MSLYIIVVEDPKIQVSNYIYCFQQDAQEEADEISQTMGVKTSVKAVSFAPCFVGGQYMGGVVTRYNEETQRRRDMMTELAKEQGKAREQGIDLPCCLPPPLACEMEMHKWWESKEKQENEIQNQTEEKRPGIFNKFREIFHW